MADLKNTSELSTDMKVLIVNGQTLVDETRKKMKERGFQTDLTGRMQLRDDCADVEKRIKKIMKGKTGPKEQEGLRLAIIRLQTTVKGLTEQR